MEKEFIDKIITEAIDKGFEAYKSGNLSYAELLYRQIINVEENNIVALQMLGLIESRKPEMNKEALEHLHKALKLDPKNADIYNNLGLVYSWSDAKDNEKAEFHFRKAIELSPNSLHFYSNLGIHCKSLGRVVEAEEVLLKALSFDDKNVAVNFNYATLLGELHRWEEAKEYYKKTIELDPNCAPAHYNLSTVYLVHGEYEEGWKEYEWRWETYPQFKRIYERFNDFPKWDGIQSLEGKRILLYSEQGMGDSIQFIRFCPLLKKMNPKEIIVEEHVDLISLMKTMDGIDKFIFCGEKVPEFDYHASIVSLPFLLKKFKEEEIPSKVPYLQTNYEELPNLSILEEENWQAYGDLIRVGIVWGGNPVHRHDALRSTYLKNFKILQLDEIKLFSLQKEIRPRFWPGIGIHDLTEGSEGMSIVDLKDFMKDYNCTASLIDRMDLIIAVDTAVVHLAGAMGKPVWVLTAYHNDWRWLKEPKSNTKWYPTMKIFRQQRPYDWDSVFLEVKEELINFIKMEKAKKNS